MALCMYAGFTNRIAYLSWLIYPIVLIYPYLDDECAWGSKRYSQFSIVMLLHMMFTVITFLQANIINYIYVSYHSSYGNL